MTLTITFTNKKAVILPSAYGYFFDSNFITIDNKDGSRYYILNPSIDKISYKTL